MRNSKTLASRAWRRLAQGMVASAGVLSILGSGGGSELCFGWCQGEYHPLPDVSVTPPRMTVQVGGSAVFTAEVTNAAVQSYRWCRRPPGATSCVDIAGATGKTLTVPGVNLADDGTQFRVEVNNSYFATGALTVSSAPGVVFADTEFVDSNWTVKAIVDPLQAKITHTESQIATGGNPGAYRSVNYAMPNPPGSVKLFHTWTSGIYDPATLGAIYTIDFAVHCQWMGQVGDVETPSVIPTIEQGSRIFKPQFDFYYSELSCNKGAWETLRPVSVSADEFVLVEGPACGPVETCPDFSAQALPIHLGFVTSAQIYWNSPPGSVTQGIDNWKVTVWRR